MNRKKKIKHRSYIVALCWFKVKRLNNFHRLSEIMKAYFKMGAEKKNSMRAERFNETMQIFTQQNVREKGLRGKEKLSVDDWKLWAVNGILPLPG